MGGYGFRLSIIFKNPVHVETFYDALDVCKGTSLGANFTLSIPYAQLAHFWELDLAESYCVPPHIVRISVGVDEEVKLQARVVAALEAVESMQFCWIEIPTVELSQGRIRPLRQLDALSPSVRPSDPLFRVKYGVRSIM